MVRNAIKTLVRDHPVVAFLVATFAWSWFFWLSAILFRGQTLLVTTIVMIGGFGPALAAGLVLGVRSGRRSDRGPRRVLSMAISSALVFGVMALRYAIGNVPGYETLASNMTLSVPIVVAALVASLVGGWAISGAISRNREMRNRSESKRLWRLPTRWTVLGIAFYPALILVAWGMASLLGAQVEYPGLWGRPVLEVLPLYALTFVLILLVQGGNEEPGWRGFLQPESQKRLSPLVAALFVAFVWSLWHLPLYLNGFYAEELVGGMIGGGVFRVLLSIFLAWFYNRSGGNLLMTAILHASFNVMPNFLPTSDIGLLVLWLIVVVGVVFTDKMWRRAPSAVPVTSLGGRMDSDTPAASPVGA